MSELKTKLANIVLDGKISEEQYKTLLKRGVEYEKFHSDYVILNNLFPNGIPIGASDTFIENLDFPYQETSYVCALANPQTQTYLYKTNDQNGGVLNLTGGARPSGDSLMGALNRLLLGNHAIMISADNLIANSQQIWDWKFFGKHLCETIPSLYDELEDFAKYKTSKNFFQVIVARKKETFERLGFLDKYKNNKIKIFNSPNSHVVFLTNEEGYQYASKMIREDDTVHYISETDEKGEIDIKNSLKKLRRNFKIKKMLNDGGREMSNGIKKIEMLGGERVSYEPNPGKEFLPKTITDDMVLGRGGEGLDGSALKDSVVAFSKKLFFEKPEQFNLHIYPIQK